MSVSTRAIGNAGGTRTRDVEYEHWMRDEMKAGLQVWGVLEIYVDVAWIRMWRREEIVADN